MLKLLAKALAENKIALAAEQQQQLVHYLEMIVQWNRVYNLTSILEPRDMVYLHLIDSLVVQPYLNGKKFLDVGTGAGLPGIPLAIADPDKQWVLLDKVSKKTRFLTQVVAELGLKNVTVVQSRCEDFNNPAGFDSILSRAFGSLSLFVATTQHLLAPNGKFIAMKAKYPADELTDLPKDLEVIVRPLVINGFNVERHVVLLERKERG